VDDGLVRQAGDIEHAALANVGGANGRLDALADDVELALEAGLVGHVVAALDEQLPDFRFRGAGGRAKLAVVRWHRTPAEQLLSLLIEDVHDEPLAAVL